MLVRLKYGKTEEGRFMSHLDLLRTMERVFRRARLPLSYSEGFNPHPKVSYASALAVGVTSEGEYLDVELSEDKPLDLIRQRLLQTVPPGLKILEVQKMSGREKSLTAIVNMARYRVKVPLAEPLEQERLEQAIKLVLDTPSYHVLRVGKKGERQVDIRPGIYALAGELTDSGLILQMDLQTGNEGNVRPEEVVGMLREMGGFTWSGTLRIHRLGLFIRKGREIITPLER